MCRRGLFTLASSLLVLTFLPSSTLEGQRVIPDHEWCDEDRGNSRSERYCEVREWELDARDRVRVDAEPNGGIRVEGWDQDRISLLAKVHAWSRRGDPREMVDEVQVRTGNTISSQGPRSGNREGWSVSFHLMVPRSSNLELESNNGGIRIQGVRGEMDFATMNGGITLEDVGGQVRGRTTNGGVNVYLTGEEWEGEELDVQTTNGGVTLSMPEGYRANLTTGTVNGSFNTDFPLTIRGRLRSNSIRTELNGGGAPLRVSTTNGGVRIRSR